jgi:hypothetical protein
VFLFEEEPMDLDNLKIWCKKKILEHPNLKEDIIDTFELAVYESADECESEDHECELAVQEIERMIEGVT